MQLYPPEAPEPEMPKLSGVEDQGSILLGLTVLVVRGLSGEFSIGLQSRISGAGFRVEGVAQVCSVWALASWGLMWGLGPKDVGPGPSNALR